MMDFTFVGAPASFHHGEAAVKFVLDCLLVLPVKSCSVLANQVFFEAHRYQRCSLIAVSSLLSAYIQAAS